MTSTVNPRLKESFEKAVQWQPAEIKSVAKDIDIQFAKNEQKLFSTEGASGGTKWPKVSAAYAKWKRKHSKSRKTMVLSGRLRKSLTSRKDPNHILLWWTKLRGSAANAAIVFGTSDEKAAWHIDGSPTKNPHVPERDTLQHTSAQEIGYLRIVVEYMRRVKWPRAEKILAARYRHRKGAA